MASKTTAFAIRTRLFATAALIGAAVPTAAWAQSAGTTAADETGADVVVTATRRETSLQDTPLSITAVTGEALQQRGLLSTADVATLVPGVSLLNASPGNNQITIRGIGTATSTETIVGGISNSTTSVYVNQLPVSTTTAKTPDYRFVDIERVEVLRGPQGTLYGQSAMGGVVRYITNRPDPTGLHVGLTSYVSSTEDGGTNFGLDGFANIPLVKDKLSVRAVAYAYSNAGFIDVVGTSQRRNANKEGTIGGRLALRWNVTDDVTFDFTYLHHDVKLDSTQTISGTYTPTRYAYSNTNPFAFPYSYAAFGFPTDNPGITPVSTKRLAFEHLQPSTQVSNVFNAELQAKLGPVTANVILGHKQTDSTSFIESGDFAGGATGSFTNPTTNATTKTDTAELRLVSNFDHSIVDFLVGAYYEHTTGAIAQRAVQSNAPFTAYSFDPVTFAPIFITYANVGDVTIDTAQRLNYEEVALYGELTVNLADNLHLTGGYRRAHVKNNYQWIYARGTLDAFYGRDPRVVAGASEDVNLYKGNLEFKPTGNILFYAQAASGYRPGGFNTGNAIYGIPDSVYRSDKLWNYEIGLRTHFLGNRFIFNIAGYRIDWDNIQLLTSAGAPSFYSSNQNAGTARIYGVEVEAAAQVIPQLRISGTYSYTDAKLRSVTTTLVGVPFGVAGSELPGTAKHSYSALADWVSPISDTAKLIANATYRHVGSRPGDLGTVGTRAPAYDQVDLRAGVALRNGVQFQVFADNVFNVIPINRITTTALAGYTVYSIGRPRTIGARLSFKY